MTRIIKKNLFGRIISKICPSYYLECFYRNNLDKNWNGKKACFSLSFDLDYAKDVLSLPSLLKVISDYQIRATFACVGKLIEKYPEEHRKIVENGHEIINHTYTHPNNEELNPNKKFNELTLCQQEEEIKKGHEAIEKILKYKTTGFRTPHFGNLHTEKIYSILKKLGYKYSSSTSAIETKNFGSPFIKDEIMEFPLSDCPQHPFAVFDTWHSLARGSGKHKKNGEFYQLFRELIDIGIKNNSYINLYFDPQDIANDKNFKLMLGYIEKNKKDIFIATYEDILKLWNF